MCSYRLLTQLRIVPHDTHSFGPINEPRRHRAMVDMQRRNFDVQVCAGLHTKRLCSKLAYGCVHRQHVRTCTKDTHTHTCCKHHTPDPLPPRQAAVPDRRCRPRLQAVPV